MNGREYEDQELLFDALKDPYRPKTIQFELANSEEVKRLLEFVDGPTKKKNTQLREQQQEQLRERVFALRHVEFIEDGPLGIAFAKSIENTSLIVNSFIEGENGIVLSAAKTGKVNVGDLLSHVNNEFVLGSLSCHVGDGEILDGNDPMGPTKAIQLLQTASALRPVTLTFVDPYMHKVVIRKYEMSIEDDSRDGGPSELILKERTLDNGRRIYIDQFEGTNGTAENCNIYIGDHLVFVNGLPVGAGCAWFGVKNPPTFVEVMEMLQNSINYPMGLTFARPKQQKSTSSPKRSNSSNTSTTTTLKDNEAETISVMVDHIDRLGCIFQCRNLDQPTGDIVVADFVAVPGIFQRTISSTLPKGYVNGNHESTLIITKKLSINAINGEFVPSYATVDMVKNALVRSWKNSSTSSSSPCIELLLCDDDLKHWLSQQQQQQEQEQAEFNKQTAESS